jgi:transposase
VKAKTAKNRKLKTMEIKAWIGIDWADQKHDVSVFDVSTGKATREELKQTPEALQEWIAQLRGRYEGGHVAVVLEQGRGALVHALLGYEFLVLYIVNPKALSSYREAFYGSGAKSDPVDAELLQEMVRQNPSRFRAWQPEDEATRGLRLLTEGRRKLVDDTTALTNQLTALLKGYYPQALEWAGPLDSLAACDFLEQWPALERLQTSRKTRILRFYQKHPRRQLDLEKRLKEITKAQPLTRDKAVVKYSTAMVEALVAQLRALLNGVAAMDKSIAELFQEHPDRPIFESVPGAGVVMAPRLLAAFGADRDRFEAASDVQEFSGIAPVTEQSGKQRRVHRRYACPKFLRQTFHEFANHSRRWCAWAEAYYSMQLERGKRHHVAIRALAYKWIRILFRCWKNRVAYDDSVYSNSLTKHQSAIAKRLAAAVENL